MIRKTISGVAAVALALAAGTVSANVLIQSTFTSGAEGWRAFSNTSPSITLLPVSTSAGQLVHDAPSDGFTSFFLAPSSFVSALHGAIGGSIAYDVGSAQSSTSDFFFTSLADVQIRAGTNRIRASLFSSAPGFPTLDHVSMSFTTASPWEFFDGVTATVATQSDINSVLAGATSLIIRAEYWSSALPDHGYLDNVSIAAIPEPETYAMLLAGLGLLGFAARRRKLKEAAAA